MGSSNVLVPIALALFFPAAFLAFRSLGPTRGTLAALLGGWLFLPVYDGYVDLPFLRGKVSFVATSVVLVSLLLDRRRWLRLRPHAVDLVAASVCVSPFVTALSNDLGPYEGGSAALEAFCVWVTPYLLGRAYLGEPGAIRKHATWFVGAGLVYVPLCLWEIRMSPQLHRVVYGYRAAGAFGMAVRYGGYRPSVFMANGLAVGIFMATVTLVAYWLWRSRAVVRVAGLPLGWCTLVLAGTTVLVKSTGAIVLLAVGIAALEATRLLRSSLPLLVLTLLPVAFCAVRVSGWTASEIVQAAGRLSQERAQSLEYRVMQEQALLNKANERRWLGWGRWGRSRVYDSDGEDVSVTDSLWIIALGTGGLVGLIALGLLMLAPAWLLLRRFPARHFAIATLGPAAALVVASTLWVVDSLLNNMNGPLYLAMAGGTVSLLLYRWPRRRAATRREGLVRPEPGFAGGGQTPAWGGAPLDRP